MRTPAMIARFLCLPAFVLLVHQISPSAFPASLSAAASVPAAPVDPSSSSAPPSFRDDIIPLLTRYGCNQGGCHGKLAGQNGFRLSLRGYAPDWDHEWLSSEFKSRRLNFADPAQSLLLLKPTAEVPHEGGQRFAVGSRAYKTLLAWIAARAPGLDSPEQNRSPSPGASKTTAPSTDATGISKLEVLPSSRSCQPGETQQLLVRAHYSSGTVRDVTWLAQFYSNDDSVVKVTPDGLVQALRPGETSVRVHFQGQVEIVLFTIPYSFSPKPQLYSERYNSVDGPVFEKLKALRIPPSNNCDDAAFIRRAFLDTIGKLPTAAEVSSFLSDSDPKKRSKLADALLARPEFADYWTLQIANLLQNRKERDHDVRGAKGVRALHAWLREQIAANRPWDAIARDILTASGDTIHKPQIGYFVVTIGESGEADKSEVASSVAQSFLGTRIGCARCHNHPLEKFTQDDYYHFTAFFSRLTMQRTAPEKGPTTLAPETQEEWQDHRRIRELEKNLADLQASAQAARCDQTDSESTETARRIAEQEKSLTDARRHLVELENKMPGVIQPRTKQFLAPQALDHAPLQLPPNADPRVALASWMTDPKNEYFSGSMINRLWQHFLGVGLVEPVDDLRQSNPPSNPALWNYLTREFVAHHFDLQFVIRLILNSRTYQLASATVAENENDRRFYSHYYARRLPAEVLLDAIGQTTGIPDAFPGYPVGLRAVQLPDPGVRSYFLSLFGRSERVTACSCEQNGDVTLPQLLHLENGDDILSKMRSPEGALAQLLKDPDDFHLADQLFLATLARHPRATELGLLQDQLHSGDARADVYRDLFWALLNTKEFAFNH